MRILLAGGGSGGHVTPLRAIAEKLRAQQPDVELFVITDRSFYDQTVQIFKDTEQTKIHRIFAGKLRRYHGKSLPWHFTHLPTLFKNIRDIFFLAVGFIQSVWLLLTIRPDVVFCKGGFVCVPIGFVSRLLKIRLVIHDSDTKPGMTNKILSRWAHTIATGMPAQFYPYKKSAMVYTGMPVNEGYQPISGSKQAEYKKQLGFEPGQKILLLTGGGNGAVNLNILLSRVAGELLEQGWGIIHLAGKGKADSILKIRADLPENLQKNWHIEEFAEMLPRLLAADVVVARTSASTLQECANAQKFVIGIASPNLSDQQMNSEYFESNQVIMALDEHEIDGEGLALLKVISESDSNLKQTQAYARALHEKFAKPRAADELAAIILNT